MIPGRIYPKEGRLTIINLIDFYCIFLHFCNIITLGGSTGSCVYPAMENHPYLIELPGGIPVLTGHFGTIVHPQGTQEHLLFNPDWELLLFEKTAITIRLPSRQTLHLPSGRFLLLPANIPVWWKSLQDPVHFSFLHFSFYPIPNTVLSSVREDCLQSEQKILAPLTFSGKEAPGVLRAYRGMVGFILNPGTPPWQTVGLLKDVVSELAAFASKLNLSRESQQMHIADGLDPRIQEFCRQIALDPTKQWKISEMAKSAGISRGHLSRLCRSNCHIELKDFIIRKRLDYASQLLTEDSRSSRSIKEISAAGGFSSPAYFARQFTKFFGVSPSSYPINK